MKTFEITYTVNNIKHIVKVKNCYTELQAVMKFREIMFLKNILIKK